MEDMDKIARLSLLVVVVFMALPSAATGDIRQFIPRIYSTEGELDVDAIHESNDNKTSGVGLSTKDSYFSERFVLTTTGYVYHPRFFVFLAKLGVGLAEEQVTNNLGLTASDVGKWKITGLREYDFKGVFLQEHPYNLELYALRTMPYARGRIQPGLATTGEDEGAIFRYKLRPWSVLVGYNRASLEAGFVAKTVTDTDSYRANAVYFKDWGSISGGYTHSDSATSFGGVTTGSFKTDNLSFNNQLQLIRKKAYLTSNISEIFFKQVSEPTFLDDDRRFTWDEQLSFELPWNLTSNITYNHFNDTLKTRVEPSPLETTLTDKSDSMGFSLTHRLFSSLVTTYSANYNKTSTTTGDTKVLSNTITSTYTKNIPWGRLTAGFSYGISNIDRTGAANIINEVQNAALLGEFTLKQTSIDQSSITIRVKSPVTGLLVDMVKDFNYLLFSDVGNAVRIRIVSIPVEALVVDPAFVYEFTVTYSLTSQDVRLRTTSSGFFVNFNLFDRLVNPYYSYFHYVEDLVSGSLTGGGEDSTTNTIGVSFEKERNKLLFEYRDIQSRFNPNKQFRSEAEYNKNFSEATTFSAKVFYWWTKYLDNPVTGLKGYAENTVGGNVSFSKNIVRKNMQFSLIGGYTRTKSFFEATTYSFGTTFNWKIAKLELNAGATINHTSTDLTVGKQENMYQYYFLSMKRKLW